MPRLAEMRLLREILAQLQLLNQTILLTDAQRSARAKAFQEKLSGELSARAGDAIDAENFALAEKFIASLADRVPDDEKIAPLRRQLDEARQAAAGKEIADATRRVNDLMALGSFDQAEIVVAELNRQYPEDADVAALAERVSREGQTFRKEQQERMYGQVARLAEERHWRQALQAANEYIESYPAGPNADVVRTMLETIRDNARIEEVRELRDRISDLIERHRYAEAVAAASDVIERFPDTRAAEQLGQQMPRLRELARSSPEDASPGQ